MIRCRMRGTGAVLVLLLLAANQVGSAAYFSWSRYAKKPDEWFRSEEGRRIAANLLSHQSDHGGWPTDIDTSAAPATKRPSQIRGTFDDGATTNELRFLARSWQVTQDPVEHAAFLKGLDLILDAQYPNGGWPQSFPSGTKYPRYITFNDNAMVNILELLRDVAESPQFAFVDGNRRSRARKAFQAGIGCILMCQVVVDGKKTVWCAQHDEVTLKPRPARTFELESLSGAESARVLRLLMSLEDPSGEVVQAVEAGVKWFDAVKLTGIKEVTVNGDKRIVQDASAPPLWARFYELGTHRPIFAGRDGVKKYDLAEIEPERRNGYAWYVSSGQDVARDYARWSARRAGNP